MSVGAARRVPGAQGRRVVLADFFASSSAATSRFENPRERFASGWRETLPAGPATKSSVSGPYLESYLQPQTVTERVWEDGITIDLRSLLSGGFELTMQLPITVRPDPYEGYVSSDDQGFTYGTGATIRAAIEDYQRSLIEELELLERDEDVLSPELLAKAAQLRSYIQRR